MSPHVLRRTTVDPHPIARGSEAHLAGADSASTHIGAASPHATSGETEETSDTKIIGANTGTMSVNSDKVPVLRPGAFSLAKLTRFRPRAS